MLKNWVFWVLLAISAFVGSVQPASAQWGCWGPFYPWRSYYADSVPYFMVHPPMYYGLSLLRPVDPWCPLRPVEVTVERRAEPQMIINPYVVRQPEPIPTPAPKQPGSAAVRITNPYVAQR
jgi:hypothetical protein